MRIFPGHIKSGNLIFSQGNLEEKKEKGPGKVGEFSNFPKKSCLLTGFWKFHLS